MRALRVPAMGSRRWLQLVPSASGISRVSTMICGLDVDALLGEAPRISCSSARTWSRM
jgi:hypothetical protein